MVGRIYVRAPVSSNIITTTVTVNRMTPLDGLSCRTLSRPGQIRSRDTYLRAAAAPRKAYVPGVIHGASGTQNANIPDVG
jgi:hypothetical protein